MTQVPVSSCLPYELLLSFHTNLIYNFLDVVTLTTSTTWNNKVIPWTLNREICKTIPFVPIKVELEVPSFPNTMFVQSLSSSVASSTRTSLSTECTWFNQIPGTFAQI